MRTLKIIGVNVFLEKRKTRMSVGVLAKVGKKFIFTYNDHYFKARNIIPLGPEFPLTQKQFSSETLFPSFEDRIPSKQNPAYPEYCLAMNIDPNETDPIILLSSIGRKGPSSFIFYPLFDRKISNQDVLQFRKFLGLTTREFAAVFEFSQGTLNAFERNRSQGNEIQKRLEILLNFPNVTLDLLQTNGGHLTHEKLINANRALRALEKSDRAGEDSNL